MRVAVVTPYFKEPLEILERCRDSVRGQTYSDIVHIIVADGHPRPELDAWDVTHVKIPGSDDYGDSPRLVGAVIASAMSDVDAIAFLDGDNWYEPAHIATLVNLHVQTGAPIITAARYLRRLDGSLLAICKESDGQTFNDTNCYLLTRPAFRLLGAWGFKDKSVSIFGDRVFWNVVLQSGLGRAHSTTPTVNYVTAFAGHYLKHGEEPPPGAKGLYRGPGDAFPRPIPWTEIKRMQEAGEARPE
jgi:glycosyltransferase involved in cell wall biosynthesis